MERLTYDSIEEFCAEATDLLEEITECDAFADVSIICKYEEAKEVLRALAWFGCELHSIEMRHPADNDYFDEFIITISKEEDEIFVWCQPMKSEYGYLKDEASITYIFGNCSSAAVKKIESDLVVEVSIGEDKEECCCPECTCKENYSVNGKSVSKDEFIKFRDNIYKEMEDHINGYRRIIDRMDDMFRLL